MFKDKIKVYTTSSGTQYVKTEDVRALKLYELDLDALIMGRIMKYREEQARISQLVEELR